MNSCIILYGPLLGEVIIDECNVKEWYTASGWLSGYHVHLSRGRLWVYGPSGAYQRPSYKWHKLPPCLLSPTV